MAVIWAKVSTLRRDKGYAIAKDQAGQKIYVRLYYAHFMEDLELGDILEIKELAQPHEGKRFPVAVSPRIIGYAPDLEEGPSHAPEEFRNAEAPDNARRVFAGASGPGAGATGA